jgi:hypothetical protein
VCVDFIVSLLGSNTEIGCVARFLFLIGMLMCAYLWCVVVSSKKCVVVAVSATDGFGNSWWDDAIVLTYVLV